MVVRRELRPGARCRITPHAGGAPLELEVRAPLASGAQSQTYLARRGDGSMAVVKSRLREDQPDHHLVIEERILVQLRDERLVRFLGRGTDDRGELVLAYERVFPNPMTVLSKPAVRRHFPRDPGTPYYPPPPRLGLALCVDLLRAVEHMHEVGFVHHDVKLGNLMVRLAELDRVERVFDHQVLEHAMGATTTGVLIDIGAARSHSFLEEWNRGEVDRDIVPPRLTPSHAPPEALLDGRPRLHPSLDVYAASLVLYACIAGVPPYHHLGVDRTDLGALLEVKARERAGKLLPIAHEALAAAPGVAGDLAGELFAFMRACLDRHVEQRPTARAAREHLERIQSALRAMG